MLESSSVYQYLAVISMNLLSVSFGISCSWSSSSILILKSNETPINNGIPLTDFEASWITSLLGLGGLVGTIVFGIFADIIGRKKTLFILAFPQLIGWMLIFLATDATLLYVSRFLSGFSSGGIFLVIPVYTAEISEDRIRGKLGSYVALSVNLGIFLGFVACHYLSFFTIPKFAMFFSIVFFGTFIYFPESPIFFISKNKLEDANKALQIYRNSPRLSFQHLDFYQNEWEKIINEDKKTHGTTVSWADFQLKSTRKSFLIGFVIVLIHTFSGVFVMTNYAAAVFTEAGSSISPNAASIFIGLLQFIGTFLSTFLVDKIGRRPLLSASAIGTGMSLLIFGSFSYITTLGYNTEAYDWIPIVTFSSMLFTAACGILPLLTVIISEFMPDKLRTIGTMSCTCVTWFLAFILLFCFPSLLLVIGLHGCIFIFSGSCFMGSAFAIFYMPETKGKSFNEILQALEE